MAQVKMEVTPEKQKEIGQPLVDAINQAQINGHSIDEVLVAMMIILGSMIQQRGARLFVDKPLREALPPIVYGYELDWEYPPIDLHNPQAQAFRKANIRAKGETI